MSVALQRFVVATLVACLPLLVPGWSSGVAQAQYGGGSGEGSGQSGDKKADEKRDTKRKTKRTGSMSEKVYKRLAQAQEAADPSEETPDLQPDYLRALSELDAIKVMPKLSPYERAQMNNFYGFIYYSMERYNDAIRAYQKVLQEPEIPEGLRTSTIYTVAQLKFILEDYQGAIDQMNQWLAESENPGPEPFVFIATGYYQLEQYRNIIGPIERAMSIARERETPLKEQWWLLLRVAYWELDDIPKVKDILEILVVQWPKKEYWTQLSAMYGELDQEKRQLSAYEAAYDQGLLQRNTELVQLAQLFLQAEVPYKAARVLEKAMNTAQVEKEAKNFRLLSQAWTLAQEDNKAVPALKEAARLSDDGVLDVRLAQSYLNLSRYKECIEAARTGIRKGDLKRADTANMVLGMCLFESDNLDGAKNAFRQAARDGRSKKNANSWLNYIQNEQKRLKQLQRQLDSMRQASRGAPNTY